MDRNQVVEYLKAERDHLNIAIAMLEGGHASAKETSTVPKKGRRGKRGKRTMSPEARARIAAATKARWAKFRKEKGKSPNIRK